MAQQQAHQTALPERICIIGATCTGVSFATVLATRCNFITHIHIIDKEQLITQWNNAIHNNGTPPVFEPGLLDQLQFHVADNNRMQFTQSLHPLNLADVIFICTENPIKTSRNEFDYYNLAEWESAWRAASRAVDEHGPKTVVDKTTLPIHVVLGYINRIRSEPINENPHYMPGEVRIVFNPEFYRQGTALHDIDGPTEVVLTCPDDVIHHQAGLEQVRQMYTTWLEEEIIVTLPNLTSAQIARLSINMLLAAQISAVNSIDSLCDKTGADSKEVFQIIQGSRKFNPDYLHSGIGFGGPGLLKDMRYMAYLAQNNGLQTEASFFKSIIKMNDEAKKHFVEYVIRILASVQGKVLAIFGYAHKSGTSDIGDSPAISVCSMLLDSGARLRIHDPQVPENRIRGSLPPKYNNQNRLTVHQNLDATVTGAEAICILTDWPAYSRQVANYGNLRLRMRMPVDRHAHLFNGRRSMDFNVDQMAQIKFKLHTFGTH